MSTFDKDAAFRRTDDALTAALSNAVTTWKNLRDAKARHEAALVTLEDALENSVICKGRDLPLTVEGPPSVIVRRHDAERSQIVFQPFNVKPSGR